MSGIEAEVTKAEHKALPLVALQRTRAAVPPNIEATLDIVETAIDAARDFLAVAQEQLDKLKDTGLETEAQRMMQQQTQSITLRMKHFESRLTRTAQVTKATRDKVLLQQKKEALLREAAA